MFRITEDPSSGSLVQCLAKNYKNDSIVSVGMDKVGVMAAYSDPLCVCIVRCIGRHRAIVRSEGFYVNGKSTDTSCDRTSDLPICSAAP